MIHHPPHPTPWHAQACDCAACNPPVPSVAERWLLATIAEMALCVAFGVLNVWIVDWLLDGPGIQIMWGA